MTRQQIMALPYIYFVLSMLDAPWIDYDKEETKEKTFKPKSADEEIAALTGMIL